MRELIQRIIAEWYRIKSYDLPVVGVQLLVIGLVVWCVVRFLRGTRGARLVKGGATLLVCVYVLIRLLPKEQGWERLEFLYGKFLLFAFVATVVALQPELRRALIMLGQARLVRGFRGEVESMVNELVASASYLSRNKVGAIIAIERSVGLGALAETGTELDAEVTARLLNTIFYPGTALHDMGVIIRGGRIVAAGCQFPLAESDEVDPSLGSRHRAALGLAKDSDALVIVASEETGRVSLAYEGQLYLGLEPDTLREMLVSILSPKGLWQRVRMRLPFGRVPKEE